MRRTKKNFTKCTPYIPKKKTFMKLMEGEHKKKLGAKS